MIVFTKVLETTYRKRQTYDLRLHVMSVEDSHCDELALLAPA